MGKIKETFRIVNIITLSLNTLNLLGAHFIFRLLLKNPNKPTGINFLILTLSLPTQVFLKGEEVLDVKA